MVGLTPALWSIHTTELAGRVAATLIPGGRGRLAVVAPHPDDEILAAAPFLVTYGPRATVIVGTDGDGFGPAVALATKSARTRPRDFERFGHLRRREQARGLALLTGRTRTPRIVRLGFSDKGLWPMLMDPGIHRSPYTGDTRTEGSSVGSGRRQDATGLFAALERTLGATRPDVVLAPHPADAHPDHRALAALTELAVADLQATGRFSRRPTLYRYLVHSGTWPLPKGFHPGASLAPPRDFLARGTRWYAVPASPALRGRMRAAVGAHRTQLALLRPVLLAFVRRNALVARLQPLRLGAGSQLTFETPPPAAGTISPASWLLRRVSARRSADGSRLQLTASGLAPLRRRTLILRAWQPRRARLVATVTRTKAASVRYRTLGSRPVLVVLEVRAKGRLVGQSAPRVLTLT